MTKENLELLITLQKTSLYIVGGTALFLSVVLSNAIHCNDKYQIAFDIFLLILNIIVYTFSYIRYKSFKKELSDLK